MATRLPSSPPMPLTNTRFPATKAHASGPRSLGARFVRTFVVVFAVVAGSGIAAAGVTNIAAPASSDQVAERVFITGDGLLFPIDPLPLCEVLNNFGGNSKTFGSGSHQGLDIGAWVGQEVFAVEDGFLYRQFDGSGSGLGWGLWSDTDVKYRYFHLDSFAEGLQVGDRVTEGQLIGYVGDTGNATPGGWHLHFEVRPGPHPQFGSTDPVDPLPLLDVPSVCNVY